LFTNDNKKTEALQDIKNGRKQPWKPKKVRNLILADSLHRLKENKKANRVWWCSMELGFLEPENSEKRLKSMHSCRERLCPICGWRKSLKVFYQVSKVMNVVQERHKEMVPVFLTLTMKNCTDVELPKVLDDIFKGWYQFTKHRKTNRVIHGWFRALEVTYDGEKTISEKRYLGWKKEYDKKGVRPGDVNMNYNTFHPHIHTILLVEKGYFKSKDYMQTTEWVQMWRKACKLDYDPICDIRKVKNRPGKGKGVADVAKYTLKDTEFLTKDKQLTDKLVSVLGSALRGRRLYAFGGLLKKIAKELDVGELAEGDLINLDGEVREDVAEVVVIYRWHLGLANYIKDRSVIISKARNQDENNKTDS